MSRILKSDQTVTGSRKVGVYQPSQEDQDTQKTGQKNTEVPNAAEQGYALISETKRKILERARSQAEQSAARILEEAYSQRDKIVNIAAEQAQRMKEEAEKEGYRNGIAHAEQDIAAQLSKIRDSVTELAGAMQLRDQAIKNQLAELSLKIAEKILCKKLEEDESILADLVEKAVLSERDKRNMVVHLSDHSMELVELMEERLEPFRERSDGFLRIKTEQQPPGYVQLETEEGIVDASVMVQLENLKQQLAELENQKT